MESQLSHGGRKSVCFLVIFRISQGEVQNTLVHTQVEFGSLVRCYQQRNVFHFPGVHGVRVWSVKALSDRQDLDVLHESRRSSSPGPIVSSRAGSR